MALATLITLTDIQLAYGHHPLLDHADFAIQAGERIGLIGRNGAGKSSLLRLLDGRTVPDDGDIARSSGLRVATVEQEPELDENATVFDVVCNVEGDHEDWQRPSRVRAMLEKLGLPADAQIAGLSGGTRKRVALARALVEEPDLLLLDEPTNHLDFDGIAWLEEMLRAWKGAAVIITHDRRFLDSVATRIVELDRGRLLSFPGNFSQWQERKAQWLESERLEQARFDKLLAQEEVWIRKGVEARRTRNEGRVRRLERLRVERAERRERVGDVSLALAEGQRSGKLVAELEHVGKRFGDKIVVDDYSTTILRGDRIGIIGPNGAGKTTLLKLILGEMQPDSGKTRTGTNVSVAYFDQMRAQLDENATLVDIISPGSEWVEIGGTRKHVMSYLGDFLFSPARAGSPVRSLSGGERARLLLARLFARPANVLVLDEPTNDLDIETLELLEELLQEYSGTVLLVSHDRAFLNNVVTQTIAYEGNGHWRDYVGGYDEWVAQRPAPAPASSADDDAAKAARAADEAAARAKAAKPKPARAAKMNSWELRELEGLPDAIAALEAQQAELAGKLADGSLYRDAPAEVERINAELSKLESELEERFARWELLEARREGAL
ncbi:ATP-binding cassette domain-containing protein [Achromobacter xylosoxidans]|uniref:ATP-binding cassette domain-containing protein n=1 Tax=Alcaligenes xylosoxydans xylosoxydans TaxID=85698 RepID=UPI0001F43833|nr:ATP-binding cassette domain-containing protein [Achromobacter xylosoxidans]AHC45273.1 ATPase component of ABC transporter [Achromobacter xylosoxidans NBRC 15126 = ATCC 27061]EFV83010.1 ABC transporter ATP-binding protein [Achromobacter xylosoxidans C54]KMJ89586.1 ABC transporter ATP-binding protein [Achromobacter xylosoxidans]KWU18903.1 ABC transporter ATP-binding protein [Achromobacter xylosoxidans]MCZ8385261.1 ATP-binding cassette domain-containing protein [Achromobacter xylosoxidans]